MSELLLKTFELPDLGEGLTEAEIVAWHAAPGDRVVADQPLVSVETAKAVVEIPSPRSGRIERLIGEIGDIIPIGETLVEFADGSPVKSESVVGELPHEESTPRSEKPHPRPSTVRASPAVRRRARELGVDLQGLQGTGPGGSITPQDVDAAVSAAGPFSDGERLRGPRRTMSQVMTQAGQEVVHATVTDDATVDIWPDDEDPTLRLIGAVLAGVEAEPRMNAWFNGPSQVLLIHEHVDLGIATDTPDGLFVPVLRNANAMDGAAMRSRLEGLKSAVKNRSIVPSDLQGQTITLSNFGMLAGRHASLVVAPPQVAILGAGRITERAVVREGKIVAARVLPLSLSFDHRAITGGEAARFLAAAIASLERPTV